ncbi:hypothetical protein [Pseudoalteromonas sp. MTN2-4]|uniref:hypothetical protein n=1 Tax=Pseudoalteromonas sp. MTN2-4 TaxID=3056555 RepID=UPI0036F1DB09
MKIKNLTAIALLFSSINVLSNELPYDCKYSNHESNTLNLHKLPDAISAGWGYYGSQSWTSLGTFLMSLQGLSTGDSFKVSGPSYVLRGVNYRYKADLDFLDFNDKLRDVNFYNSERGFLGQDRSDWDSNAYFRMKFSSTYGSGLMWARSSGRCQAIPVIVQEKPEVTSNTTPSYSRGKISTNVRFKLDTHSKAITENSPVRVSITLLDELYLTTSSASVSFSNRGMLRGNKTVSVTPHLGGGLYKVSVRIFDGTYSHTKDAGWVRVPGTTKPPCSNCQPK